MYDVNDMVLARSTLAMYRLHFAIILTLGYKTSCATGDNTVSTLGESQNYMNGNTLMKVTITYAIKVNSKEPTATRAPCLGDSQFYRNPRTAQHLLWTAAECSKYYLCLDEEVFEFKCSQGLLFDVTRQICDFKTNIDNCDVILADEEPTKPQAENGSCDEGSTACGDGSCLATHYFCDGNPDCPDASDEAWCENRSDVNGALPCDRSRCKLPHCWCSEDGTDIPGNLTSPEIPQMITLSFEDAVNPDNFDSFIKMFTDDRKNPNGCPIRATFFVSHQYTNYRDVQHLWNLGHEIAIHSVTHRGPEDWWMQNATVEDWFDEMVGEANIINRFAGVRMQDIKGMRVPYLRVGWNRQFLMMTEFGFVYDSSIVAPPSSHPIWPYTLDYQAPHVCAETGQMCPTRSYPGIWEIPINPLLVGDQNCQTFESCSMDLTEDEIYGTLMNNFKMHYSSNRAPLGLHFSTAWIKNSKNFLALSKFVEDVLRLPDVYFVTNQQILEWMRHPRKLESLRAFGPWHCYNKKLDTHEIACDLPNLCKLPSRVLKTHRYLQTCFDCPKQYPWLRNEFGHE
ncbi:uncharacterized protein LOC106658498 [Trichogramma pretiosum]|uniref:uncharacterized protein LOC106658498 n=1 Tax=Trichogramma pretiosum TaxID=7493 RepID=UPI0006C981E5|nr:uncharacterized protein LOC106658498 [Trichogramma pretiosum]